MAAKFMISSSGATWDNTNDTIWSTSSGGANNTTHPVAGDTVTLDAASGGGTVTVNATLAMTSLTMGAFTGTLDFATNNNSITLSTFSGSGAGTRTLNMGNGTWTLTGTTGTVFDLTTVTGLTFNTNSSTILLSATPTGSRTLQLGGKTHNAITINDTGGTTVFQTIFTGPSATITTLTLTNCKWLTFGAAGTYSITNAFSYSGTSGTQVLLSGNNAIGTVSVAGACTLTWAAIQNITKAGAGSIIATNAFDLSSNSGVTITGPTGGISRARAQAGF